MPPPIRVLCVDDDADLADLVATYLNRNADGVTAFAATTGDEALDLLGEEQVDCIVSDYEMPEMDGLELLDAVQELDPELPFILFTGRGSENVASQAVAAGVTDYIPKSTGTEQYDLLVNRIRNAVERSRATATNREIFNASSDAIIVHDVESGTIVDINRAGCHLWAYGKPDLIGTSPAELCVRGDGDGESWIAQPIDDESRPVDWLCERRDGEQFWAEIRLKRATIDGEPRILATARDVTERKQREATLGTLLTATHDLVGATTADDVTSAVLEAMTTALAFEDVRFFRPDGTGGSIELIASAGAGGAVDGGSAVVGDEHATNGRGTVTAVEQSDASISQGSTGEEPETTTGGSVTPSDEPDVTTSEQSTIESESGVRARALEAVSSGVHQIHRSDVDDHGSTDERGTGDELYLPVGGHGVLVARCGPGHSVDDYTLDLVRILVATTEAALDRASRDRKLERQHEELASLNHTNEVIRDINETLVHVSTRDEIEQLVCKQLAVATPFVCAWIGEHDLTNREITPRAWAGRGADVLEDERIQTDEEATDPTSTIVQQVIEDRTVGIIPDLRDESLEPDRRTMVDTYGYRSAAFIPIVYQNALYDVLVIYAEEPNAFGETERDVLAELGETIGYAMHTAERARALVTDSIVEVEYRLSDSTSLLVGLSAAIGGRVELERMFVRSDGSTRLFVAISDASVDDLSEHISASQLSIAEDVRIVAEREDVTLVEIEVAKLPLVTYLSENVATLRTAVAEDGEARVVIELPGNASVRTLTEHLEAIYDEVSLLARRQREGGPRTAREFTAKADMELTTRQHEVLLTAFQAGFFSWPRESTGEEIADLLDISQPTFHEHLRSGERKLLEMLFEDRRSIYS